MSSSRAPSNQPSKSVPAAGARPHGPRTERLLGQILQDVRPDLLHATHLMKISGAALRPALRRQLPIVVTLTDFWAI